MKEIIIHPKGSLRGRITVPGDKSVSHRSLIFAALAQGTSTIRNLLLGEDVLSTMGILQTLGVKMSHTPHELKKGDVLTVCGVGIHGFQKPSQILDCGNSGTTMRLMMGLLASQNFEATLTGDDSLNRRPMQRVMNPLTDMGASFRVENRDGKRLITVIGNPQLKGKSFKLPVASAQLKSAILLAGLGAQGVTTVEEPAPSRDHTERMLTAMGADLTLEGHMLSIDPDKYLSAFDLTVPGDFSSAAFFLVAGLIVPDSEICIEGVGINPTRRALLDVLLKMGGSITLQNERVVSGEPVADLLVKSSALKACDIGGDLIPNLIDEIPIFCIAAARASGVTRITDAAELRIKESDRLATMAGHLTRLGVPVVEEPDGLVIEGGFPFKKERFESQGDHRIAMSLSIAALLADGPSGISNIDCVATSFPGFFELLESLRTT